MLQVMKRTTEAWMKRNDIEADLKESEMVVGGIVIVIAMFVNESRETRMIIVDEGVVMTTASMRVTMIGIVKAATENQEMVIMMTLITRHHEIKTIVAAASGRATTTTIGAADPDETTTAMMTMTAKSDQGEAVMTVHQAITATIARGIGPNHLQDTLIDLPVYHDIREGNPYYIKKLCRE